MLSSSAPHPTGRSARPGRPDGGLSGSSPLVFVRGAPRSLLSLIDDRWLPFELSPRTVDGIVRHQPETRRGPGSGHRAGLTERLIDVQRQRIVPARAVRVLPVLRLVSCAFSGSSVTSSAARTWAAEPRHFGC